jgi:hypothetical protein
MIFTAALFSVNFWIQRFFSAVRSRFTMWLIGAWPDGAIYRGIWDRLDARSAGGWRAPQAHSIERFLRQNLLLRNSFFNELIGAWPNGAI